MKSTLAIAVLCASASAMALQNSLDQEPTYYGYDWIGIDVVQAKSVMEAYFYSCKQPQKITLLSSACEVIGEITGPDTGNCKDVYTVDFPSYADPADPSRDTKAHVVTITDTRTNHQNTLKPIGYV